MYIEVLKNFKNIKFDEIIIIDDFIEFPRIKEQSENEFEKYDVEYKIIENVEFQLVKSHYHKHHYYRDCYMLDYDYKTVRLYIKK